MNSKKQHCDWGLLFDLDGVLIDSENSYSEFWHHVNEKHPTGVDRLEYVIKGKTLDNILSTYYPEVEVQDEIVRELREHEATMEYCLFEGVENFLQEVEAAGILTAIVTSSNKPKMLRLFEKFSILHELMDVVITDEDVTRSKPDPQGYNLAAKRLGLKPERCIVFEDSMAGVEAGRRAGGAVVGVATTNSAEKLREFADVVINSFSELTLADLRQLIEA